MSNKNYSIKKSTEPETENEEEDIAVFQNTKSLKLTKEQQERLVKEINDEEQAIDEELGDVYGKDYPKFCKSMDNQYDGIMPRREGQQYAVDTALTKIKENEIVRSGMAAIFSVDPRISVEPRPDFAGKNGVEICEQQMNFLDYALDERVPLRKPLRLAMHSATRKRVGLIKLTHKIRKVKRIRQEHYEGDEILPGRVGVEGAPQAESRGVEKFLQAHGEEVKQNPGKYDWVIKGLMAGKDQVLDVDYDEITFNDPYPVYVDPLNFKVRKSTEGYEGLKDAELTIELEEYTYYQLKQLEKEYDFINVDELLYDEKASDKSDRTVREGARNQKYTIKHCVYQFKMDEDDEDTKKIISYQSQDKDLFLGAIEYPFSVLDCYYFPIYAEHEDVGFYGGSPDASLTSPHIASNAFLNLALEGVHTQSTITPITPEDSDVDVQFANHRWAHGIPINANPKDIDFLNNHMKPLDIGAMMLLKGVVDRIGDDVSRVSSLKSGKESPLDPTAPMGKVLALINQSDEGIKDYVDEFAIGFNNLCVGILQMYYEISQNDQQYINRRIKDVTGGNPFATISRQAMIARTLIQSQAHAYNFDKLNEKRENLAIYQILRPELLISQNPQSVHFLLTTLIKSWSPQWKNAISKLLPDLNKLKQMELQVATQAVVTYMDAIVKKSEITQQPPEIDPEQLKATINQFVSEMATPPPESVVKEREKESK